MPEIASYGSKPTGARSQASCKDRSLDLSVIVVSFNTREVLRQSLKIAVAELEGISGEIIVVDNNSRDGSPEMVVTEFPSVHLIVSPTNLGFAAANNLAFRESSGRYILLLNSDAFAESGSFARALGHCEADPLLACAGGKLIGRDGSWQPSRRSFPSLLNELITLSGLGARYPRSRFLGRVDHTWADQDEAANTDWVPGAFALLRRSALETVGFFDESFFLYYEEVDLCRRLSAAGYHIRYFPDLRIVHLGGESSRSSGSMTVSEQGSQVILWRLRSEFLYYRKHHGSKASLVMVLERGWYALQALKARFGRVAVNHSKRLHCGRLIELVDQAWRETRGGRVSPPRPW